MRTKEPLSLDSTDTNWFSEPQAGHIVQFYQSDNKLLLSLTEFMQAGIKNGETCIVVATPTHLNSLNEQLKALGIDILAAQAAGTYTTLDASETLARFMVNGMPNRNKFFNVIGALVEESAKKGQPLRAYGEMVALLWRVGSKDAVLQLEDLWNELAKKHSFSLFCAYPELHFLWDRNMRDEIQGCHGTTHPSLARA